MTKIFGDISNINEGDEFVNRQMLRDVGLHLPLMDGIDGNPIEGASSIVLNGGYVDDYDLGDEIVYTGHGGNDSNTRRQISDQSWNAKGNKGLLISELHGLPVRVIRGHRHRSSFSPKNGYKYGGLFFVSGHFEDRGKDGFVICRFKLKKLLTPNSNFEKAAKNLPIGNEETKRISSTTLRIVRDTNLSRELKALYNYTCQICGIRIAVNGIGYAEAAHVKPLGKPHNGNDQPDNLLCLCPNHHVMFDKGVFTINDDLTLNGIEGKIQFNEGHSLIKINIEYHKQHIYLTENRNT